MALDEQLAELVRELRPASATDGRGGAAGGALAQLPAAITRLRTQQTARDARGPLRRRAGRRRRAQLRAAQAELTARRRLGLAASIASCGCADAARPRGGGRSAAPASSSADIAGAAHARHRRLAAVDDAARRAAHGGARGWRAAALDRLRAELVARRTPRGPGRRWSPPMCRCALLPVRLETRFDRRDGAHRAARARLPRHGPRRHARARADRGGARLGPPVPRRASARRREATTPRARRGGALADRFGAPRAAWIARAAALANPPRRAAAGPAPRRRTCCPTAGSRSATATACAASPRSGARSPTASRSGPTRSELAAADPAAPLGDGRALAGRLRARRGGRHGAADSARPATTPPASTGSSSSACAPRATPTTARAAWPRLLDAHHYTGGLALVAPGTPTNNTASARSAWTCVDDGAARPAQGARRAARHDGDGRTATLLARALGVPSTRSPMPSTPADAGDRRPAHAHGAVAGDLGLHARAARGRRSADDALAEARAHFIGHVAPPARCRRCGSAASPTACCRRRRCERWQLLDPADVDAGLPPLLRALVAGVARGARQRCRA